MTQPEFLRMTADEFVVWNARHEGRFELVDGYVIKMMTGTTGGHALATSNTLAALKPQARQHGCMTLSSDYGVRTSDIHVRYPDVVVTCGDFDPASLTAANPVLVVEVASPSTSAFDATEKVDEYRAIPSVHYILRIEPTLLEVVLLTRVSEREWGLTRYWSLDDVIPLPKIGATLTVADICADLQPKHRRVRPVET